MHFAGEHTDTAQQGYIDGAVRSGERERDSCFFGAAGGEAVFLPLDVTDEAGVTAGVAALARVVERAGIRAEISTEAAMGCGFGACLGCVIPGTEKPFVVSCLEGPILPPGKIAWEKVR